MGREVDVRDFSASRGTHERAERFDAIAAAISDRLPGNHRVVVDRLDSTTGTPANVRSLDSPAGEGQFVARALAHVNSVAPVLGLAEDQVPEFSADPTVVETSTGARVVHLQQRYKGIPIFEATEMVVFDSDGSVAQIVGSSIPVVGELAPVARVAVEEAVRRAAAHAGAPEPDREHVPASDARDDVTTALSTPMVDLTSFEPTVRAAFTSLAERPTVLSGEPFTDDIKASLVWFPVGHELRLGWQVRLTIPNDAGQYSVIVDAETARILYCRQLMQTVAARGLVHLRDGNSRRMMVPFPPPLTSYGIPVPGGLPSEFPDDWVSDQRTQGNSTNAVMAGTNSPVFGAPDESAVITFEPEADETEIQQVLNAFFYCCSMHDYLYLLGFREADGNFQQDNLGRGGAASDRVNAFVFARKVFGIANMGTLADGKSPTMRLGYNFFAGQWRIMDSDTGRVSARFYGDEDDVLVPFDYDRDGITDFAIWRHTDGHWVILNSSDGTTTDVQWGEFGDIPVPGDYNGDGKTDFAVWRQKTATWFVKGGATLQWGDPFDVPVPGDYTGDGRTDFAVWRPSTGTWLIRDAATGEQTSVTLGRHGDVPVPADYSGDGRTDFAVWRPETGT